MNVCENEVYADRAPINISRRNDTVEHVSDVNDDGL